MSVALSSISGDPSIIAGVRVIRRNFATIATPASATPTRSECGQSRSRRARIDFRREIRTEVHTRGRRA
ncbi:hypothetical protein SB780_37840, partial [Burkholderia sp. SIMBA_057]